MFEPLGMRDSGFALDADHQARLVRRPPEVPFGSADPEGRPNVDAPDFVSMEHGAASVKTTAPDLAAFAQMFLNGGTYNGARVLSRATVAAMTRNQIPGIPTEMAGVVHPEASYGYGWLVENAERWAYFHGSLRPHGVLSHPGAGGANIFFDPTNDLMGVVLEIATVLSDDMEPLLGIFDRFENVIYSAIEE